MKHDVFISYSRDDEAWAQKLEQNLADRGFTVYRDCTRLVAGDEWEPTLRNAIVDSRTLAVLWSSKASKSNWVLKEQEAFRQMMHVDDREGRPSVRRMIQVCLEGSSPDYMAFQTVNDLDDANYAEGAAVIDPNLWVRVVEKVAKGISISVNQQVIHQVVLASTRQHMQALTDDCRPVEDAARYVDLVNSLSFASKHELVSRYGDARSEWRPFGGQKTILTILAELREQLLARGALPFLWNPVGEDLWSGIAKKRSLRDLLRREACVIVLDAVSLYDTAVWERYDWLLGCLDNPKAAIVVLPPYSSNQRQYMRTVLEAAAAKMFEPFYRPDQAQVPIVANCCVLADDDYEMSRVIAAMIRTAFRRAKSEKLRFGSGPRS